MIRFREIPYRRPDMDALKAAVEEATRKVREAKGGVVTFTVCAAEYPEGTLSSTRMADTGRSDVCRTENTVISFSPRVTRAFTPFNSSFTDHSVHAAETSPSRSIASSMKNTR